MVDFAKLLERSREARKRPRFFWRYVCDRCHKQVDYVTNMPAHLLSHSNDGMTYPRCFGRLTLVRMLPEDDALERCRACHDAGRRDRAKGLSWIDPECAACGGQGAVKKVEE